MSIKPILFKTDMVQAILDGRKTMTRRAIKPQPAAHLECGGRIHFVRPPCLTGDILYIRETWAGIKNADGSHLKYVYRATDTYPFGVKGYIVKFKWRPSIHMPKAAARIWLRVTDVRAERLRDITPDGAIKEGTKEQFPPLAVDEFREIWNATIKKPDLDCYGWEANPWVWVIEFERCEKPEEVQP